MQSSIEKANTIISPHQTLYDKIHVQDKCHIAYYLKKDSEILSHKESQSQADSNSTVVQNNNFGNSQSDIQSMKKRRFSIHSVQSFNIEDNNPEQGDLQIRDNFSHYLASNFEIQDRSCQISHRESQSQADYQSEGPKNKSILQQSANKYSFAQQDAGNFQSEQNMILQQSANKYSFAQQDAGNFQSEKNMILQQSANKYSFAQQDAGNFQSEKNMILQQSANKYSFAQQDVRNFQSEKNMNDSCASDARESHNSLDSIKAAFERDFAQTNYYINKINEVGMRLKENQLNSNAQKFSSTSNNHNIENKDDENKDDNNILSSLDN